MEVESGSGVLYDRWIEKHERTIWTRFAIIALGIWLLTDQDTFGLRQGNIKINDLVCGILLILFGALALSPKRAWPAWGTVGVGIWLELAPLVFWAGSSTAYLNDTIVGVFAIAFAILIPGTPKLIEDMGPEIPKGWSYNPSSWLQRLPVISLAYFCWLCARYMAEEQLGYIHDVYDPIFGNGTMNVITSQISKDFPVSDAGLGAFAYTIEVLMGCKGSARRWHTMPWMVIFFGILVVPVGLISIVLIMLQPLAVGSWCGWCLLTAAMMLLMVTLTIDEVFAVLQVLFNAKKSGKSFWKVFWHGDPSAEGALDTRTPSISGNLSKVFYAMVWGMRVSWNLLLTILIGGWLMFSPEKLGVVKLLADLDHIFGALIVTASVVAFAEVMRAVRYFNILFGGVVLVSALILGTIHDPKYVYDMVAAILVIILSIPKGKIYESYGMWDRYIV